MSEQSLVEQATATMNRRSVSAQNLTTATAVVVFCLGVFVAILILNELVPPWIFILVVVAAAIQIYLRLLTHTPKLPFAAALPPISADQARQDAWSNANSLLIELGSDGPEIIENFTTMVVERDTHTYRITDNIEFSRSWTRRSVSTTQRIPGSTNGQAPFNYVPILIPEKGTLYSDLKVSTDRETATLTHQRSQALAIAAIRAAFCNAYGLGPIPREWGQKHRVRLAAVLNLVLLTRAEVDHLYGADGDRTAKIDHVISALLSHSTPISDPDRTIPIVQQQKLDRLIVLTKVLCVGFVIVAEIAQSGNSAQTSHSYSTKTGNLEGTIRDSEASGLTKLFHKLIPKLLTPTGGYYEIPMRRAQIAQSYHLDLRCPEGSYIHSASLEFVPDPSGSAEFAVQRTGGSYVSVERPYFREIVVGQARGHFYSRSLGRLGGKGLRLRLRIREQPSGAELTGMVTSSAAFIATLMLYFGAKNGSYGDTIVTVLIAAPTALGGVVALYARNVSRAVIPSIVGVAIGVISVAAGILSLLLYLLEAYLSSMDERVDVGGLPARWHQVVLPWWWQLVLLLAAAATFTATSIFVIRFIRFLGRAVATRRE